MFDAFILLSAAAIAALGSPGPATLALAGVGASFGPRRGMPFLTGVVVGLAGAGGLAAIGLAAILAQGGLLLAVLLTISVLYFVYVAYKIATSPIRNLEEMEEAHPPTFRDGVILNLTNPKVYAAFAAIYAGFRLPIDTNWLALLMTGAGVTLWAVIVDMAWLWGGGLMSGAFASPRFGRALRVGLATVMLFVVALSLWAMVQAA